MNYLNEFEPSAAAWLRDLRDAGHIPPCDIDTRSIEDVRPSELRGYTQCHFFAGIGGWPLALALAGWPADRPVWTGSCPCQPFSAAGAGAGFADQRHLWPAFFHLIAQCRPAAIFGEQVASAAVGPWLDLVHADLEAVGYAFGCIPFPAAGIGAPHIRDRNYWVGVGLADTHYAGLEGWGRAEERAAELIAGARGLVDRLADAYGSACGQGCEDVRGRPDGGNAQSRPRLGSGSVLVGLADAERFRLRGEGRGAHGAAPAGVQGTDGERQRFWTDAGAGGAVVDGHGAGPVNGHWRAADWLGCRDGQWRPVEPGTFPLAHGLPARVGRLRGYGNAIVPQAAAEFIRAFEESCVARRAA